MSSFHVLSDDEVFLQVWTLLWQRPVFVAACMSVFVCSCLSRVLMSVNCPPFLLIVCLPCVTFVRWSSAGWTLLLHRCFGRPTCILEYPVRYAKCIGPPVPLTLRGSYTCRWLRSFPSRVLPFLGRVCRLRRAYQQLLLRLHRT